MKLYLEKSLNLVILFVMFNYLSGSLVGQDKSNLGEYITGKKILKISGFTENREDWINTYKRVIKMKSFEDCFQLFLWKDELALRQIWWESEDQEIRLFTLSLLSLNVDTDYFESKFSHYLLWSNRFSQIEKKQRLLECDYFVKNYKIISDQLLKIMPEWTNEDTKKQFLYYRDKHIFSHSKIKGVGLTP